MGELVRAVSGEVLDPEAAALVRIFSAEEALPEALAGMLADLNQVMGQSIADATKRAYRSDWQRFEAWCRAVGACALPADGVTVAAYLVSAMREQTPEGKPRYATATMRRWLSSINQWHARAGLVKPVSDERVPLVMAGISRERSRRQKRVDPLHRDDVYEIIEKMQPRTWPAGVAATRDAALLSLGYIGAFRRDELRLLTFGDVAASRMDGMHVTVRRSKADQEGVGHVKAVPFGRHSPATCPPCAVWRWIKLVEVADAGREDSPVQRTEALMGFLLNDGPRWTRHICREDHPDYVEDERPLFRRLHLSGSIYPTRLSGYAINLIVKSRVESIGLNPDRYGGHSMRAGFITDAFRHGADVSAIQRQTGHTSASVLEVYRREHSPMVGNAVASLGY